MFLSVKDEWDNPGLLRDMQWWQEISQQFGATLIFCHHPSQANRNDLNAARGGTAIPGWMSLIFHLEAKKLGNGVNRKLYCKKARNIKELSPVSLYFDPNYLIFHAPEHSIDDEIICLVQALDSHQGKIDGKGKLKQLFKSAGGSLKNFDIALQKAKDGHRIKEATGSRNLKTYQLLTGPNNLKK